MSIKLSYKSFLTCSFHELATHSRHTYPSSPQHCVPSPPAHTKQSPCLGQHSSSWCLPSMLKMKSLAVWTSRAVWSPKSPCSSSTSSDACRDSCSSVAPDRKSTSEGLLTMAGERGATALINDSMGQRPDQRRRETVFGLR